jgi:K+-sensing histidine kinase KdpD
MSHAIRVPLNGVLGFSQIIANNEIEMDEPTRKEYSGIIQQNTEQLMRLVNNVLDLSRLEAGMMKFQMSDYDIVQLCKDAVGMAQMQNPTLHTHFHSNIDEYIIHTDTNRIMQLIVSLLICPLASFKEERDLQFTLDKNGEILCFKVTNCPLADLKYANQDSALRNDVNHLLLKHFSGTYQVIPDSKEGPTILFTYPAAQAE